MKKNILFTLLLAVALFAGCRKDSPEIVHPAENSYTIYTENYWSNLFNDYWHAMSQSYVFWKYETIDWDDIYDEYAPKFAECDDYCINDPDRYFTYADTEEITDRDGEAVYIGDAIAYSLFREITYQLLDHHYGLNLYDINMVLNGSYVPDIWSRDYFHENIISLVDGLESVIVSEKEASRITDFKGGSYEIEDSTSRLYMFSYLIDGTIPYLYFSAFSITDGEYDVDNPGFDNPIYSADDKKSEVLDNFESLVRNTANMKGAIIDVRGNGGGNNDDLEVLLGRFINKDDKLHFANSQHKSGPNRYDYTQVTPCYIYGTSEEPTNLFPIVMLADLWSMSMAEITCIASRSFSDKSIMVGERTSGGTCSLVSDYFYAGGIVETDNFRIYSSTFLFYDLDMNFYEGVGITPDIEVLFDEVTWGTTDSQKNAAIDYIKGL